MDELTRFEYQKKAIFADIALDIIANDETYQIERLAEDEKVKESSQIIAFYGASDFMTKYVCKYGYENFNGFVMAIIARMPQKVEGANNEN